MLVQDTSHYFTSCFKKIYFITYAFYEGPFYFLEALLGKSLLKAVFEMAALNYLGWNRLQLLSVWGVSSFKILIFLLMQMDRLSAEADFKKVFAAISSHFIIRDCFSENIK